MSAALKSPFPYFGGKSSVAPIVWQAFGDTPNFVEPFFGSGAVLLARPEFEGNRIETVNDKDGFVSNFWRATQSDPEQTAHHADWPVNENDLHARHAWLVGQKESLQERLEGDPAFFDSKIAGWWVWGMSAWIGSGFCSGQGPWMAVDGRLVRTDKGCVNRQLPHLGDAGQGVNRQLQSLLGYFATLADRLRSVRVCCGDWQRVCGPTPTEKNGLTAVFLDPPYSAEAGRDNNIYRVEDTSVAHRVREWAIERGHNPRYRIALCGYDTEHAMPDGWTAHAWKAQGGYGNRGTQNDNRHRETIWFSPHCLPMDDASMPLFRESAA